MSIPILPPSSPFSSDQRAWLNGFFAGVFGADAAPVYGGAPVAAPQNSPTPAALDDGVLPWHDPALSLDERMALAEGRPLPLRLMAAMAQLDCGQCGYVCKTYAAAIADGSEKSLKKCVPGAKVTADKLKEIMAAAAA